MLAIPRYFSLIAAFVFAVYNNMIDSEVDRRSEETQQIIN